jgi:hypothetical protein
MKCHTLLTALVVTSILEFASCSDSGIPPPQGADTTSHAFTWAVTTLGDGGGSSLNDVAIINDTLVYAVGELYLSGETARYNLVVWNGNTWRIQRVPYFFQGQPFYHPIQAVLAFGPNDIWFAGNGVIHWNGQQYLSMEIPSSIWGPNRINKIWGSSSSNLYIVGDGGSIAEYDHDTWRKVGSGTSLPIQDIWGAADAFTGQPTILAIASGSSPSEGKRLFRVQGTTISTIPDSGLSWSLTGIWFIPNAKYYVVGAGIHYKSSLQESVWNVYSSGVVTSYHSGGIRGNDINDVFVVGSFFEIVHFNGSTWYNYRNEIPLSSGALGRVAVKGNLAIAVGLEEQHAAVVVGRR